MTKFLVKTKSVTDLNGNVSPMVKFMTLDSPYCVLDIWKYREKRDGVETIVTKFLIGDHESGLLHWVDAHGVDFVGVV